MFTIVLSSVKSTMISSICFNHMFQSLIFTYLLVLVFQLKLFFLDFNITL